MIMRKIGNNTKLMAITILGVIMQMSCNENTPTITTDEILAEIEGMYIGTFTNEFHNGTYERQGTSYTGNVTITNQSVGIYSLDVVCDDYGINTRIEGVKISKGDNRVHFSKSVLDVNDYKSLPIFWTAEGNIGSDRHLEFSIASYIYGSSSTNGTDIYHFSNGKKIK